MSAEATGGAPRGTAYGAPIPQAPGLGESQRRILLALKRRGPLTLADVAREVDLARETLREHLNALAGRGLVRRAGTRRDGPGRPEILFALSRAAEALFPRGEGRLLRDLAAYLVERDATEMLRDFLEERVERRRGEATSRLRGLEGRERLEEVAEILSEEGFMARVEATPDGELALRLCHCPIRELVEASRLPCEIEVAFVRELVGEPLRRVEHMPEGDLACTYRPDLAAAEPDGPDSPRA